MYRACIVHEVVIVQGYSFAGWASVSNVYLCHAQYDCSVVALARRDFYMAHWHCWDFIFSWKSGGNARFGLRYRPNWVQRGIRGGMSSMCVLDGWTHSGRKFDCLDGGALCGRRELRHGMGRRGKCIAAPWSFRK